MVFEMQGSGRRACDSEFKLRRVGRGVHDVDSGLGFSL